MLNILLKILEDCFCLPEELTDLINLHGTKSQKKKKDTLTRHWFHSNGMVLCESLPNKSGKFHLTAPRRALPTLYPIEVSR